MKKVISMLVVVLLLLMAFAGCGSAPASKGESGNSQNSSAVSSKVSSAATDQFENKELNIAVFEGGFGSDYWYGIVEAFEAAYEGVKVNMQISPTIGDTIRPQIAAGDIPDFLVLNGASYEVITSLILEHGLLDITDVFEGKALESDEALKDKILDGLLDSSVCSPYGDGKIYQAPLNGAPGGLVYNATLFKENGWEVPATWDEFFELGEKAKEKGISLLTWPGIYPGYLQNAFLPAMKSAVGEAGFAKITSYQEGSVIDTEALEVLKLFERMTEEDYIFPGTVALNHTQSQQELLMDHVLFIPNGTWIESEMADAPRADGLTFAMAPAPAMKAGDTRYVQVAMETMSIPVAAKNPELAKEFLRFLYTDQSVLMFAEKANAVGATKDSIEMAKSYISESMYNMYSIFNEENVKSAVLSFDTQAQGSKVSLDDELWGPVADVVNGAMTADVWAENIENAFAQIRSELEAAQ